MTNVDHQYNGATFECVVNDVSMAQRTTRFPLKIYGNDLYNYILLILIICFYFVDEPILQMVPMSGISQLLRCNRRLNFEMEIVSIPNELKYLNLTWFKNRSNQTISIGDSRVIIFKHYYTNTNGSGLYGKRVIRAGLVIRKLVPDDTGLYILKASLMNGLINKNITLELEVLPCHISKCEMFNKL